MKQPRAPSAGSFKLLGIQTLGITAILAWTAVTMTITFLIIKKTVGLRVSKEEEIKGLAPHPAVTPTRPASEPFKHIETSGLPFLNHVYSIVVQVATAGAIVVV